MLCDDELVAPDTLSLTVRADKRRETQTEASVLAITGIEQYIPDVEPLQKIILCQFLILHCLSLIVSYKVYRLFICENVFVVPVRVLPLWPSPSGCARRTPAGFRLHAEAHERSRRPG